MGFKLNKVLPAVLGFYVDKIPTQAWYNSLFAK